MSATPSTFISGSETPLSSSSASSSTAGTAGNISDESPRVVISIRDLRKDYGAIKAVKGIDLDISEGEIFGLIGPDGAGKTTIFQILGGVMQPTSGEAIVHGQPARAARASVGYLTQTFSLYQDLSVAENLRYIGELRKLSNAEIESRGHHYLEMFDMDRFVDRLAGRLSGGMKQKLALACALIAQPKILLLDEPTTGVDPVSRREFWDALVNFSVEGMTIVIATPYLDEAERCARVALINDGMIHQSGTPSELRQRLGLIRLEVHAADLSQAEDVLEAASGIEDVQRFGDRLDVMVRDAALGEKTTREALSAAGVAIEEVRSAQPTLENTFVSVLREIGGQVHVPPFPRQRVLKKRTPEEIAIGARDLHKTFGDFHAVSGVNIEVK
ncbi:MAG: ATP-binding cassette domain-containing protein, partial [Pyrinomonadaceae bacterium]